MLAKLHDHNFLNEYVIDLLSIIDMTYFLLLIWPTCCYWYDLLAVISTCMS